MSVVVGGGGRANSESWWPDPPKVMCVKPVHRLIGKTTAIDALVKAGKALPSPMKQVLKKPAAAPNKMPTMLPSDTAGHDDDDGKPKGRAKRGTAGTWLGRRPPKDPELLKVFLMKKAQWQKQKEDMKGKQGVQS